MEPRREARGDGGGVAVDGGEGVGTREEVELGDGGSAARGHGWRCPQRSGGAEGGVGFLAAIAVGSRTTNEAHCGRWDS